MATRLVALRAGQAAVTRPIIRPLLSRPSKPTLNSSRTMTSPPSASQSDPSATSPLAEASCIPCRKGTPMLSDEEVQTQLNSTYGDSINGSLSSQGWSIIEAQPGEHALHRRYTFKNFRTALAFTNVVARIAEDEKHHPRLVTEWGAVSVDWWTHAIGGLHQNDFVMAAKTEVLSRAADGRKT